MKPIVPMLASSSKGFALPTLVGTHIFDVKLDGVRSIAYWDGFVLKLINRSGREHTVAYPDLVATHPFPPGTEWVIDGEIVAMSGSFEDVSRRDKCTRSEDVRRARARYPVQFIAFDVLQYGSTRAMSMSWTERRMMLENLFSNKRATHKEWDMSVYSTKPEFLQIVAAQGLEGVIAKRTQSAYRSGRQKDWIKFKNTFRISAIATGYEFGTGARRHFGAMTVAVLDKHTLVPLGRVGTGFTFDDTWELKKLLDNRAAFVVEIEVSNITQTMQMRFPVYKGIRSDLSVTDATIDQLQAIPRS